MKKRVILFVIHELSIGGAERITTNLVNNISREKFDIHLCLFKKKGELVKELYDDINIHNLNAPRVLFGFFKFINLIITLKPAVVFTSITHVNLLLSISIPIFKLFRKEIIFVTREVNIPSIRAKYMPKSKRIDFFYKRLIHNYDHIVAQSNYMRDDIIKSYRVNQSKIKVINNPLDIGNIRRKISDIENNTTFKQTNKINIVAVGNLRKQKGFENLLEIMTLLDNNYHLSIVGKGAEQKRLEEHIDNLNLENSVTLLGAKNNPYQYMKKANIVVLSSLYEGFPNVILEANACGKFVVAFECPGVGKEIIQDGVNGHLVKFRDKRAFAKAIEKYSTLKYDTEAIIQTTNRYRVSNIIKEYEKIFLGEQV